MTVSIANLRSTWSNSAINYTGLGLNVNASAYSANSKVINLKVNNNSILSLDASNNFAIGTDEAQPYGDWTKPGLHLNYDYYPEIDFSLVSDLWADLNYVSSSNTSFVTGWTGYHRSRGTTTNKLLVNNGDTLGELYFAGHDGNGWIGGAGIVVQVDGETGENNVPGRIVFTTQSPNSTSLFERMRIDSAGRVGIGTTGNGFHKLVVEENTNSGGNLLLQAVSNSASPGLSYARLRASGAKVESGDAIGSIDMAGWDGSTGFGSAQIQSFVDGATGTGSVPTFMRFLTTPSGSLGSLERMRIDSSGRVGIGTSNPEVTLDLSSTASFNPQVRVFSRANDEYGGYLTLAKGRGTSAVQTNDYLGTLIFGGLDSAGAYQNSAYVTARATAVGTGSVTSNMEFYASAAMDFAPTTDVIFNPGFTERMRITSAGRVGIGTSAPDASALLDVTSTTGGILFPRMTSTQRDAIGSPANGLVLYNTTTNKLQVRAGGSWVDLH
jgi:hypothetical protein